MQLTKALAKINRRFNSPKSSWWKSIIAQAIAKGSAALILLFTWCVDKWGRTDAGKIEEVAWSLTGDIEDHHEVASRLCKFVYYEVYNYPLDKWLSPQIVLLLGIGDCKNQAVLLHSLLSEKGVEAEVVVGLVGWKEPTPRVHAWVNVRANGSFLICDPTLYERSVSEQEYASTRHGFIDVSEEYKLKKGGVYPPRSSVVRNFSLRGGHSDGESYL